MTRRLLLGSRSRHKLDELRELLRLDGVELMTADDIGVKGDPVEDADTFEGNAAIKARYYAAASGLPTLADDSGLEVEALDGGPGIATRRYAGPDATDEDNIRKLLAALDGLPADERRARYVCVLAYLEPTSGTDILLTRGTFDGRIAAAPRGTGGFGYDPIFEPADEPAGGRTVGQLTPAEKHARSHRAKAADAMAVSLRALGWSSARPDDEPAG